MKYARTLARNQARAKHREEKAEQQALRAFLAAEREAADEANDEAVLAARECAKQPSVLVCLSAAAEAKVDCGGGEAEGKEVRT